MKINKNSWHYRSYEKAHGIVSEAYFCPSNTLCGYFWGFVWSHFLLALGTLIVGIVIGFVLSSVVALFFGYFYLGNDFTSIHMYGMVATIVSIVFATIVKFGDDIEDAIWEAKQKKSEELGFFGIIWENIKAAKNKVCPMVEYTEE